MELNSASPLSPVSPTSLFPCAPISKPNTATEAIKETNPFSFFDNPFDKLLCLLFQKEKVNQKGYLFPKLQLPCLPKVPDHFLPKLHALLDSEIEGIKPSLTVRELLTYFYKRGAKIQFVGSSLQQFLGSAWFFDALKVLLGDELTECYSQQNLAFIDEQKNDIDFRIALNESSDPLAEAEKFIEFLVERQHPGRGNDPQLKDALRSKVTGPFEEYNPSILIENKELKNNAHLINFRTKNFKIDLLISTILKVNNIIEAQDLTLDFTSLFIDKSEEQLELKGGSSGGWQCIVDTSTKVVHFMRFNTTAWKKAITKIDSGCRTLEPFPMEMAESLRNYCKHKNGIFEGISKLLVPIIRNLVEIRSHSIVTIAFNIGFHLYNTGFPLPEIQKILDGLIILFPKDLPEETASLSKAIRTIPFENLILLLQLEYLHASSLVCHLGTACVQLDYDDHYIYIPLKIEKSQLPQLSKTVHSFLDHLPDRGFVVRDTTDPFFIETTEQLLTSTSPSLRNIGVRLQLTYCLFAPSQPAWETLFFQIYEFNLKKEEIDALTLGAANFFDFSDIQKLRAVWSKCSKEEWILRLAGLGSKKFDELAFRIWKKPPELKDARSFYSVLIACNPLLALQMLCEGNQNQITSKDKTFLGEKLLDVVQNCLDKNSLSLASRLLIEGTRSNFVHTSPSVWIKYFELIIDNPKTPVKHLYNSYQIASQQNHFKKEHFRKHISLLVSLIEKLNSSDDVDHQQLGHTFFTFLPKEKYQDALSTRIKLLQQRYQEIVADQEAKQGNIERKIKIIEGGVSNNIKQLTIEVWGDLCKKCPLRGAQINNLTQAKNLINRIKTYFQDDVAQFSKLISMLIEAVSSMEGEDVIPIAHSVIESGLIILEELSLEDTFQSVLYLCTKLLIKTSNAQIPNSLRIELNKVQSKVFQYLASKKDYKALIDLVFVYIKCMIEIKDIELLFDPVLTQVTQLNSKDAVSDSLYETIIIYGTKKVCEGQHKLKPAFQLQCIPGIISGLFQKKKGSLAVAWIKYTINLLKMNPINYYRVVFGWAQKLHDEFEEESIALFEFIEESYDEASEELQATFEKYPPCWIDNNVRLCGKVISRNLPVEKSSPIYSKLDGIVTRFLNDNKDVHLALKIVKEQPETSPEVLSKLLQKGYECSDDVQEDIWKIFSEKFSKVCPKNDSVVTLSQQWVTAWSYYLPIVTKIYNRQKTDLMYARALSQLNLFTVRKFIFEIDLKDKVLSNILSYLRFFAEMGRDLPKDLIDKLFVARRKLNVFREKKQIQSLHQFDMYFLKKSFQIPEGVIFHNSVYLLHKLVESPDNQSEDYKQNIVDLVTLAIVRSETFFQLSIHQTSATACIMLLRILDEVKPLLRQYLPNQELIDLLNSSRAFHFVPPPSPYFEWSLQERDNFKIIPIGDKQPIDKKIPLGVKHLGYSRGIGALIVLFSIFLYFYIKESKK